MLKKLLNRLKMMLLQNKFHSCGRITLHSGFSIAGHNKIQIGEKFFANRFLRIEVFGNDKAVRLNIGDGVAVGENVHIAAGKSVEIQNNVLMGSRILITDHNHGAYSGPSQSSPEVPPAFRDLSYKEVLIGANVWIGDGVIVLPGAKIGSGSIIGANSIVKGEIPENVIAVGTPCKIVRRFDEKSDKWVKV